MRRGAMAADEVVEDAVGDVLVERAVVAVAPEVQLERLELDERLVRHVGERPPWRSRAGPSSGTGTSARRSRSAPRSRAPGGGCRRRRGPSTAGSAWAPTVYAVRLPAGGEDIGARRPARPGRRRAPCPSRAATTGTPSTSASSSACFDTGLPWPWPARVSSRSRIGRSSPARGRLLEAGRHLAGVVRVDPRVLLGGGQQHGGVAGAVDDPVVRRVGVAARRTRRPGPGRRTRGSRGGRSGTGGSAPCRAAARRSARRGRGRGAG